MKPRVCKFTIAYDGTAYGGWQRQPNAVTVQELVEQALTKVTGQTVTLHGSGRTDAGVHARAQVASASLSTRLAPLVLRRALNAALPPDIRITGVRQEQPGFHARFSATGKEYRYRLDCGAVADPFQRRYAWHHPRPLDLTAMRRAARVLRGRHDFTSLSANPLRPVDNPVRTITKLAVTRSGDFVTIAVVADGFLYKMVRTIAGAVVRVGEGRLTVPELAALLAARRRTARIETAPAHGLFLWAVHYARAPRRGGRSGARTSTSTSTSTSKSKRSGDERSPG